MDKRTIKEWITIIRQTRQVMIKKNIGSVKKDQASNSNGWLTRKKDESQTVYTRKKIEERR